MYKRILVALDGSRGARLALDEALKIAAASHGSIIAVAIVEHEATLVDINSGFVGSLDSGAVTVDIASVALEEARELGALHGVPVVSYALDAYGEGVPAMLIRTAVECDADLVAMGTNGRHGLRRLLLGSVAEALLRVADRPVLLVRHDPDGSAHGR